MKNKTILLGVFMVLPLLAQASLVDTNNQIQAGRYLTVPNTPKSSQANPLQETFSITFPDSVNTIGDAMNYVLSNTSYQLLSEKNRNLEFQELLKQQLPVADRQLGPITVQNGLLALAGDSYLMLVDPKHRYISFTLKPKFANLYL
jgi:type IV pili sensor histidine kinase/response regulator